MILLARADHAIRLALIICGRQSNQRARSASFELLGCLSPSRRLSKSKSQTASSEQLVDCHVALAVHQVSLRPHVCFDFVRYPEGSR